MYIFEETVSHNKKKKSAKSLQYKITNRWSLSLDGLKNAGPCQTYPYTHAMNLKPENNYILDGGAL